MNVITIDFETRSTTDLQAYGRHNYMSDPNFKIILMAVKIDNEPTKVYEFPTKEEIANLMDMAEMMEAKIFAHNAAFEIGCINTLGIDTHTSGKSSNWRDTQLLGYYHGLPGKLADLGEYLKIKSRKLTTGKELIDLFTKPISDRLRAKHNIPADKLFWEKEDFPDKWEMFKEYCLVDVDACYEIMTVLPEVPDFVWDEWLTNLQIVTRGILVDREFCEIASQDVANEKAECIEELKRLTGITNPSSRNQLKQYFRDFHELDIESLNKETIGILLASDNVKPLTKTILSLFSTISKTSCAKYDKFQDMIGSDNKLRDFLNFYGARTGRWSSWGVQIHNMKRIDGMARYKDLREEAKNYILPMLETDLSEIYSRLLRTVIVAPKGKKLIIADFAQIEARVLQWLARDDKTLDIFRSGKDYYTYTASNMFNKSYDEISKDSPERQKGKTASLALGYGGAVGALERGSGKDMTLPEKLALIKLWRGANKKVVELWSIVEAAFIKCVTMKTETILNIGVKDQLLFNYRTLAGKPAVTITFPSGRVMWYPDVKMQGKDYVFYGKASEDQFYASYTKIWGGFLTENITQAIARDCLQTFINKLRKENYVVAFHVHDEVIIEYDPSKTSYYVGEEKTLQHILDISKEVIYEGLPVIAEPKASIIYDK